MPKKAKLLLVVLAIVLSVTTLLLRVPVARAAEGLCYVNDCTVQGQNCHCCIEMVAGFSCFAHCGEVKDCKPAN